MKEMVILNREEWNRLGMLDQVEVGKMTGRKAAEILDPSLSYVRRILAAYRED
jgi:transposase